MADQYNLSDLFLSYSRRDKEFARKIFERLKQENRSIWVDWEDIAPTVDWRNEIWAGIEAANNFMFIISPDSVSSQVCGEEIDHAVTNKKRIIPILFRDVTDKDQQAKIHPAISSHNWIFFRDTDDFDEALKKLAQALDTDLEHVRMHTRLLVRAAEWDSHKRDKAYLLRGSDLQSAADWVRESADKHPIPTQIQLDYIVTSRNAEMARLRNFASRVIAAMIVMAILGVLAVFQAISAERARETAADNEMTAVAAVATSDYNAGVAATSFNVASTNESQALARGTDAAVQAATAVAAVATSDHNAGIAATSFSVASTNESQALARGTDAANLAATAVAAGKDAAYQAGLSKSLALAAQSSLELNGTFPERSTLLALAALRNYPYTVQAERALAASVQESRTFYFKGGINAATIYAPTSTLALLYFTGEIQILGGDGQGYDVPESGDELAERASWSIDGKTLAIGYDSGMVRLWDAATQQKITEFQAHPAELHSIHYSPDGKHLITTSTDSTRVWSLTGSMEHELIAGFNMREAVYSPDGKYIATADYDGGTVWDAATGEKLQSFNGHADLVYDIAWSPDSTMLVTGSLDGTARVWSRALGTELYQVEQNGGVGAVEWAGDNSYIFTGSVDGILKVWDTTTHAETAAFSVSAVQVNYLQWYFDESSQDGYLITVGNDTVMRGVRLKPFGEALNITTTTSNLTSADWSPDGKEFITGSRDGGVSIYNAVTGEQRLGLDGDEYVAWSPDGKLVAATTLSVEMNRYVASVWNAADGTLHFITKDAMPYAFGIAFSPDSKRLAVASATGELYLYDTADGALLNSLDIDKTVRAMAWSPDGKRVAVSGIQFAVMVDAETWKVSDSVTYQATAQALAWSNDSQRLAIGFYEYGEVVVVDSAFKTSLVLAGHSTAVGGLSWSPDDTRLASSSDDRTVRVWDTTTGGELRTIDTFNGAVTDVDWSPDSQSLLTVSKDKTVRVWHAWMTLQELEDLADTYASVRTLFDDELAQFNLPSDAKY